MSIFNMEIPVVGLIDNRPDLFYNILYSLNIVSKVWLQHLNESFKRMVERVNPS